MRSQANRGSRPPPERRTGRGGRPPAATSPGRHAARPCWDRGRTTGAAAPGAEDMFASLFFALGQLIGLTQLLQLAGVRFGVLGVIFYQLQQRFAALVGVSTRALECSFGQSLKELVILGPDAAESLERLLGLAACVVEIARP